MGKPKSETEAAPDSARRWRPGGRREAPAEADRILIVGGGLVGGELAERLSRDDHEVTLVEGNRDRLEELEERLEDVSLVEGNGTTSPVLRRAGIEKASMVVSVTNSDEANLIIGFLAASFRVPRLIARIQDPDHERVIDFLKSVGQPEYETVNPNQVAVDRIAALLAVPGASDVISFLENQLRLVGFRITEQSDFANLLVRNVDLMFVGSTALVAAIRRGSDWIVPRGDDEIRPGDVVYFAATRTELSALLDLVGVELPKHGRRSVVIAGATPVGIQLARRLEREGKAPRQGDEPPREWKVTLVEENRALAERADELLGDTLVIHGEATDQNLLEEEEIEHVSTFVSATSDHETNLVAALLAKRLGAQRGFALVDNPSIANLVSEIGIDAPIVPRQLVVDTVLGYVRGTRVLSVATLLHEGMEAFEGEVASGSVLCSGKIRDVAERVRGALIVCVQRDGQLQVPRGDFEIQPGDHAVLITTKEHAESLGKQLSS